MKITYRLTPFDRQVEEFNHLIGSDGHTLCDKLMDVGYTTGEGEPTCKACNRIAKLNADQIAVQMRMNESDQHTKDLIELKKLIGENTPKSTLIGIIELMINKHKNEI